jgi:hypothetical protein
MEIEISLALEHGHFRTMFSRRLLAEAGIRTMAKYTLDEVTKTYPVGSKVSIKVGRQSPTTRVVEVKGVRQAGVEGTKGHSIWIDTKEVLDGGREVTRSVRPGSLTPA